MNRTLIKLIGIVAVCLIFEYQVFPQNKDSLLLIEVTITRSESDKEISFIPPLLSRGEQGWPDYVSEFGNPKYRMAMDMSQSFNSISLWKFIDRPKKRKYELKDRLSPRYGRYMSVSIKGLSPQYDSITQDYSFKNLHQENKEQFNAIAKSIGGFPDTDIDTTSRGNGEHKEPKNDPPDIKNLNKLRTDLHEYENYLSRSIIDQVIWRNDLRYINSKLEQHLGLNEFSAAGLKDLLMGLSSDTMLIEDIVLSYSRIHVYSIYSTPPIQIEDADLLNYEYAFFKDGKTVDKRNYNFIIRGGFKIDFSMGFAYSTLKSENYLFKDAGTRSDTTFYVNEYFEETDSILGISDTELKQIVRDKDVQNIGAAVFAHFYPRSGIMANLSGTLGFMINLDAEYSYLAGMSLILGKKQRAIISAGCNYGKVEKLNPKYEEDRTYDADELENISESQLTRKEWDCGAFVSISYNF